MQLTLFPVYETSTPAKRREIVRHVCTPKPPKVVYSGPSMLDLDVKAVLAEPSTPWDPAVMERQEEVFARRAKLRRTKQLLGVIKSITINDTPTERDLETIYEIPAHRVAFEYHQLYYKLADWAKDNDCDLERTMELLRRCHTEQMENPALKKKYRDEAAKLT